MSGVFGAPEAHHLPRSTAPLWMVWLWIGSLLLAVGGTLLILAGPMDERVTAPGVVQAEDYTLVFPAVTGVVESVSGIPGQPLAAGDLLARLDRHDLTRQRDEATHALARAQASVLEARAHVAHAIPLDLLLQAGESHRLDLMLVDRRDLLARMEAAGSGQSLSLLELVRERMAVQSLEREADRARRIKAQIDGPWAQAARDQAAARLAAAEAEAAGLAARVAHLDGNLALHEIRAPADGLLVTRSIRFPGENVVLGQVLFKIARGGGNRLRLAGGEDRVDRIRPGMRVLFRSRSDPDRLAPPRTGVVTDVALDRDLDGDTSPRQGIWSIDVTVDDGRGDLPLGASVDAEIILGQHTLFQVLTTRSTPP